MSTCFVKLREGNTKKKKKKKGKSSKKCGFGKEKALKSVVYALSDRECIVISRLIRFCRQ